MRRLGRRIPADEMLERRTRSWILIGVVACLALVVGFVVRAPIERALAERELRGATNLQLTFGDVTHAGDGYVLRDLVATSASGSLRIDAPRARVARHGDDVAIVLDRPHVTGDLARAPDELAHAFGGRVDLRVIDGSLDVVTATPEAPLHVVDVAATLRRGSDGVRYDVTAALLADGARYPFDGRAADGPGDTIAFAWHAAAVPFDALAAASPPDAPVVPAGGFFRDVAIAGPAFSATARLEGASARFGSHALRGLHGALVASGDAIGSRAVVGTLDGVPFSFAGEVHDVAHARDSHALASLLLAMANEPRVRSVRLETTAPGVVFGQYALAGDRGPLAISMLAIDPAEPTLRLGTAIAEDHVVSRGERTSALGVRTGAVGGANGDYFDIGRTYQPQGMLVRDGELVRGPTDRAALVIDRSNHVTFGEFHLRGTVRTNAGDMPITEFNDWPPGDVCVITPAFGSTLPASDGRTFVALVPAGRDGRYRVADVTAMTQPVAVRFGIAIGPLVRVPIPHRGDVVTLRYAIEPAVPGTFAAIGGGPILVRDGAAYEDPHAPAPDERNYRWPVIALAKRADGTLVLVAVDGRHPERSVGMTRPEFARTLRRLGATDAMALDSGGSVTLVSRAPGDATASVRNVPSDNSAERWVSDALFLYSRAPAPTIVSAASAPTPVPEARPTP